MSEQRYDKAKPTCWIIAGPNGGHNIPVADSERRFPRSLRHLLNDFSHRVDSCTCFNDGEAPVLVFEQPGSDREIVHDDDYQLLLEEAKR